MRVSCTWTYIQGLKQIDGRKSVVRDDVTKSFPFHKAAVSINSLEHRKVEYAIKVNYVLVALILCQTSSAILYIQVHTCSSKISWLDFHELKTGKSVTKTHTITSYELQKSRLYLSSSMTPQAILILHWCTYINTIKPTNCVISVLYKIRQPIRTFCRVAPSALFGYPILK